MFLAFSNGVVLNLMSGTPEAHSLRFQSVILEDLYRETINYYIISFGGHSVFSAEKT